MKNIESLTDDFNHKVYMLNYNSSVRVSRQTRVFRLLGELTSPPTIPKIAGFPDRELKIKTFKYKSLFLSLPSDNKNEWSISYGTSYYINSSYNFESLKIFKGKSLPPRFIYSFNL